MMIAVFWALALALFTLASRLGKRLGLIPIVSHLLLATLVLPALMGLWVTPHWQLEGTALIAPAWVKALYGGSFALLLGHILIDVLALRPDRLAVYGYAHLPHLFRAQKQIDESRLPSPEDKLALLGLAVEKLSAAGYQYIGMDHFALPEEDLSRAQRAGQLHRNFMGYTTHADTDLLGLGVSAISHIGATYSQNPRDLASWEDAVDQGQLPVWRGVALSADDQLRAELIQQLMCQGEVDGAVLGQRHGVDFQQYFAEDLRSVQRLQEDGLAEYRDGVVRASEPGRPLLRLLAMCFDPYLRAAHEQPRYSRAI